MVTPKIPDPKMISDEEEDLLDVQADVWMSLMTSVMHGFACGYEGGQFNSRGLIDIVDKMTEAYMDRFKNGLPGQEVLGSRSEPPPSPIKGKDPKAEDEDDD